MMLYITRKYPPSIGGMQRFNQKLVEQLQKKMKFRLISWGHGQLLMPFFLLWAFFKAIFLRLGGKIDSIYLSDGLMAPMGVILKTILRIPVAVNIHGRDIAFEFPGYLIVVPWALRKVDLVICVSTQLKEECLGYGVNAEKMVVIPNGVNVEDFTWEGPEKPQAILGLNLEKRVVLVTVGRLVAKKGANRFVRDILPGIVKEAPEVLYLLVGDGPLREEIEECVKENGLKENVLLLGDVPMEGDRLKAAYCCGDIFVMPNALVPGDIEGFGIVAIEGGAAKLPVVAARLQGIQQAVCEGQNGTLLDWEDISGFQETILTLVRNPEKRKQEGEKAREFVKQNYSWDKVAGMYAEQFRKLPLTTRKK